MLLDVYADSFAFVQLHRLDKYSTTWGNERFDFYDPLIYPAAAFDGDDVVEGSAFDSDEQYATYRTDHFLPARAAATDVTIDIVGEPVSGQTYSIEATVCIESGGTGKTMRIYTVQVLDYWPLAEKTYHRNSFKQAANSHGLEPEITLTPGECDTIESEFTFDADSWADQENIKIIVWAQAAEDSGPAEVYQAATRLWPLISLPGDADGDGYADGSDNCPQRYNPDQADADTDGVGDLCDNCATDGNPAQTDTDEDSFGDVCDNCPTTHHPRQDDTDGDGLGDACDSCPDVGGPAGVDESGRPLGDIDEDCDVDLDDLDLLAGCIGGPGQANPGCDPGDFGRSDVDEDGDADLADFSAYTENFTGPL